MNGIKNPPVCLTAHRRWCALLILFLLTLSFSCTAQNQRSDRNHKQRHPDKLAQQINDFSRRLYRTVSERESETNLFLSPLSIHTAMTMTSEGSDGTDRKKMTEALSLDNTDGNTLEAYHQLLSSLKTAGTGIRMNVGNAIRTAPNAHLSNEYVQNMDRYFSASIASLSGSPEDDAQQLNNWVNDQTKGTIKKLVTPADLRQVLFVLLNAVYFKGTWTKPFEKDQTREASFHLVDGSTTTVPMMQRTGQYSVASAEKNGTLIRLPYGPDERFGMIIFLPDENQNPTDFFSTVYKASNNQWKQWLAKLDNPKKKVRLRMPRFQMTFGTTSLAPSLKKLGFPLSQVDMSRMGIGSIEQLHPLHKATITVDEEGTEAAGATGVIGTTSLPPAVTVDRPFFFVIRDRKTETMMFMGTVYDPTE